MTQDIFTASEPATAGGDDTLATVASKFKKEDGSLDVEGLAKGKVEADKHINHLESELRGMRKELDTRLSLERFLEEIRTQRSDPASSAHNQTASNEAKALNKDEVEQLARNIINQERTQAQRNSNRQEVVKGLQKAWGSDYVRKLEVKAEELNLSKDFMNSVAEHNPQAFLKMVEATTTQPPLQRTAPPQADYRPQSNAPSGQRDYKYYQELRKADPSAYWSVRVQAQLHDDVLSGRIEIPEA